MPVETVIGSHELDWPDVLDTVRSGRGDEVVEERAAAGEALDPE
jgi:hypothetical protein